jgi:hypothetical protein
MSKHEQEVVDYYEDTTHDITKISEKFNTDNSTIRYILTRYLNRRYKGEVKGW